MILLKGAALILMVSLLAILAIRTLLAGYAHTAVSRVRSDMRSIAEAIEAYCQEHDTYPAGRKLSSFAKDPRWPEASLVGEHLAVETGNEMVAGLTTPIAYCSSLFLDPFSPRSSLPHAYLRTDSVWLLISPGLDGDYDVPADFSLEGKLEDIRAHLIPLTYDPTNGATSDGDVWRLKD